MNVKSAPGTNCPMEGNPKTHITDTEVVTVPDTAYYLRLKEDGSLVEVPAKSDKSKGGTQ